MKLSKRYRFWKRKFLKVKRTILARHIRLVRVVFLFVAFLGVVALTFGTLRIVSQSALIDMSKLMYTFMLTPERSYRSHDGRVNILLLGKANNDPVLTDTMMVISIPTNPGRIVVVSIPRDIWSEELRKKINESYDIGNQANGNGLLLARSEVEKVVGVPLQYSFAVNFEALVDIVDALGGITVTVERSFVDERYPIPGREEDLCEEFPESDTGIEYPCRYETLVFERGEQIMDGETALKFSRSRQSQDIEEGTDFARARRQQKVLAALQKKLTDPSILLNLETLRTLVVVAEEHTETDMTEQSFASISRFILNSQENVTMESIPEAFLYNPPLSDEYDNLYVLIPQNEDWSEVHEWFRLFL